MDMHAWVHKNALVSSLIKLYGGWVLRIRTSLHTVLSMFHDTVAVIMLAQVTCLQFDLLKRESKGVCVGCKCLWNVTNVFDC